MAWIVVATFLALAGTWPLWSEPLLRELAQRLASRSRHFRVDRIEVIGNHLLPTSTITDRANVRIGTALYDVPVPAIEKRLREHPWIRQARVRRTLPNTVRITIQERIPLAAVRGRELMAVTTDGMIAPALSQNWVWDLPILTPPRPVEFEIGKALRDSATSALLREVTCAHAVSESAWRNISELYFRNNDVCAVLSRPPVEVRLGNQPSELRWVQILEFLRQQTASELAHIPRVDARFLGRIIVTRDQTTIEERVEG